MAAPAARPATPTRLVVIAYLSFVALGLSQAILGVAWPSIRTGFGLRLDAMGTFLLAATVGSLLAALTSGPLVARFGAGRLLLAATLAYCAGLAGCAAAPGWWAVVVSGLVIGAANGALDAVLNMVFAADGSARLMNWLHASFGIGATLGPLVVTAVLSAGLSWRWSYTAAALLQALLALGFALTLPRWRSVSGTAEPDAEPRPTRLAHTLLLPVLWLTMFVFVLSVGVEQVTGQWAFSLLSEGRAIAPATAGLWVSIYWGSLTVGRVLYGLLGHRLRVVAALRACILAQAVAALLLWSPTGRLLTCIGLGLMGIAIAPVFPLLQLVAPERLGREHADTAIGFRTAAGYLGLGLMPALAGWLAEALGLEVVVPFLFGAALAVFGLHEAVVWSTQARRTPRESAL